MSQGPLPGWVGTVNRVAAVTVTLKFSRDSTDGSPGRFCRPVSAGLFHCRGTDWGRLSDVAGGCRRGRQPLLRWTADLLCPEDLGSQVNLNSGPRWPQQAVPLFGFRSWLLPLASGTSSPCWTPTTVQGGARASLLHSYLALVCTVELGLRPPLQPCGRHPPWSQASPCL